MKVFRYETPEEEVRKEPGPAIFLAGPTVRGNQTHLTSWRFAAIEELEKQGFKGNVIIPEFVSKTESDKGKDWIPLWEYSGLLHSNCIMFWVPRTRELIGLTTNWELGYWMGRLPGKVVYGRPDDAYRIQYLDIMWRTVPYTYSLPIYNTLENTIKASIEKAYYFYG